MASISIMGTGYVGLCTAVAFALRGHMVTASTKDPRKAELINGGRPPFYEPGLEELLRKVVEEGRLRCVVDRREAVLSSDITFITVATPSLPSGEADLSLVKEAARELGEALKEKPSYHVVVVKSTVPPGSTMKVVKPTVEEASGKEAGEGFGLAMNPEFLREGSAIHDSLNPDRVIIGELDRRSGDTLEELYRGLYGGETPIIRTNIYTAELIKYANNAFLALKVSFINSIANICERLPGVDVVDVARAIGIDKRIGPLFLNAGVGFGGSCLPKDLRALVALSRSLGFNPSLLEEALKVNDLQPLRVVEMAERRLGGLEGRVVAVLGLSFKPGTDDVREAPSLKVIEALLRRGAYVKAYDPAALENAKRMLKGRVQLCSSKEECVEEADCCILVTEWDEFKWLTPSFFKERMRRPLVVDGRRVYDPKLFKGEVEFEAVGLGVEG